ncbi:MAG: hypothetical protein IPI49_32960 [Myxococcales bacterium]|nr:hypothetical protein [Myxococcales bacterium]
MAASRNRKHILVPGPPTAEGYKAHGRKIDVPQRAPPPSRAKHGKALRGLWTDTFEACPGKRAPVDLPSLTEQVEIARRADELFGLADELEVRTSDARQITDRLAPSVLSKGFRGEFVPQGPTDESASALLARLKTAQTKIPDPRVAHPDTWPAEKRGAR